MFTNLRLRNFKSWKDTGDIRLAPITAFFGSNSSGKTSILQSLLLLKQTTGSPDRKRVLDLAGNNGLVDLGTYNDIMFGHGETESLTFDVAWKSETPFELVDPVKRALKKSSLLIQSDEIRFSSEIEVQRSDAKVKRLEFSLDKASFFMTERDEKGSYELGSTGYDLIRSHGRVWHLPPPFHFYGFPDQVRVYYQNASFLSDLELRLEQAFSKIRYLGPLRESPKRQYIYSGGPPSDVGLRGELAIDALVASRFQSLKNSRGWSKDHVRRLPGIPMELQVAQWLSELGLIHSFEIDPLDERETLYRVTVKRSSASVPVLLTDVGFGISQVLPVLVLLAFARAGDTVILEQPEIHLHPAVQSGLADVIVETALTRSVQVIVESHSEHLLLRLQRRLAEGTLARNLNLTRDDVALYFCDQIDGISKLDLLQLDLFGNITNWPDGFFGNPLEDSVAMAEARSRRKSSESPE